jgi:apolipoprotein N-acyltransferase
VGLLAGRRPVSLRGLLTDVLARDAVRDLLSLAAGGVLPLAFAPFGWYPLAVLSPAALYGAWSGASPRRALWRGWLFGVGMFGVGVWWVHESFRFSAVDPALSLVLTAGLIALLALYPAALGLIDGCLFRTRPWVRLVLALPAAWVLMEWFRGWFLTGFTWLQLGYSQVDSPLAGLLPLLGVYGASWAVASSAGLLALALRARWRTRMTCLLGLAVLWAGAAALGAASWTAPAHRPLRVALVQGNIPQDRKWLPEERSLTLARYRDLTRAHWGADLIVWPETALPGLYRQFRPFLQALAEEARTHGAELMLGVSVQGAGHYYNAVVALGETRGLYRKHHLVPFGEYMPFRQLLAGVARLLAIPMSDFSPGPRHQPLLQVAGQKVAVSVCYEAAFPSEIAAALPAARLLVNVSNDAWFGDSLGPHQNLEMARVRAREVGRYLARATNTGITAIIGPRGEVRARAPQFDTTVLAGEVVPMKGSTPYVRLGDYPTLLGCVLALALAWLLAGRPGWPRKGSESSR